MDNGIGKSIKSGLSQGATSQQPVGPISRLLDTAYDIANPKEDRDYGDKAKKYWTSTGTTPLGTNVRYTGSNASSKGSDWALATEAAYNFEKNVADSGITMDNKTGKITIKATDALKNSDWYKEKFAENGTFIQVARLYGKNPDADTAIQMQDKDGNIKEVKVKDWLEDEVKAFDEYAEQYGTVILPMKERIKENSVSGIEMSDKDATISLFSTTRDRNKFNDDVAIMLPKGFAARFDFDKLKSYDPETETISAKDFYDWYQVKLGGDEYTEGSAGDKMDMLEELNQALAYTISYALDSKEVTEEDVHQLARAISLHNTLANDKPEASAAMNAALFIASAEKSTKQVLTEASVNLYSFLESIPTKVAELTSLNSTSGKVLATVTGGTSLIANLYASEQVAGIEAIKAGTTNFGEFISGIDNNPQEAASVNAFTAWGEMYAGIASGKGTEAIEKWAKATNTPLNQEALDLVTSVYEEGQRRREAVTDWAKYGRVVGSFIGEIVKQVALTNVIGGAVGSLVSSAVAASASAATTEALSGMMQSVQFLENGMVLYVGSESVSNLTLAFVRATQITANGLGWTANLMAQGLVDTVLTDSAAIERLLNNPNEEERHAAYEAISYNIEQNLFGEMTGIGFTAAGRGVGYALTKTGLDAPITRLTSRIGAKKHTALARFAEWVSSGQNVLTKGLDKILKASDSTSKWYANLHWEEAKALSEIAHAAKGTKSFAEASLATQKAIVNRMEFEVARGNVLRGTMRRWQEIMKNGAINKQYADYLGARSDFLAANGIKVKTAMDAKTLPQDVCNYIDWLSKSDYLTMKESVLEAQGKTLSINEAEYKSLIEKKITDFEATRSPEYKEAALKYLDQSRKFTKAWMDYASTPVDKGGLGIYKAEDIEALRDTGFWGTDGELYLPALALKDSGDSVTASAEAAEKWASYGDYKAEIGIDPIKELKPGDADMNYADLDMVLYAKQCTAAKVTLSRDWGDALIKNDAMAKEINVDGQAVVKGEIKNARMQIHNIVRSTISDYGKQGDIMGFDFSGAYKRSTKAGLKRAGKEYRTAAYSLSSENIQALQDAGVQIRSIPTPRTRAELDMFMDTLNKAEKQIVLDSLGSETLTIKHFNTARVHTDMSLKLQRSFLANDKNAMSSKTYEDYVAALEKSELDTRGALYFANNYNKYADVMKQNELKPLGKDDFNTMVSDMTDQLFKSSSGKLSDNKFLNNMLKYYEEKGVPADVAKRYLVAQEYMNFFDGKGGTKQLNELVDRNLSDLSVGGRKLSNDMRIRIASEISDAVKKNVQSEWADSTKALTEANGGELIDSAKVFDYIYEQMGDFIDTTLKNPGVVQILDKAGQFHYYQLSPTAAQLYLTRPNASRYRKGLAGFFGKTNRLARLGNVTLSPASFVNQGFRDTFDAYVRGGLVRGIKTNAREIGELMGPSSVEAAIESMGEAGWKETTSDVFGRQWEVGDVEAIAKERVGRDAIEQAEFLYPKKSTGMETEYYQEMGGGYRDLMWGKYQEGAKKSSDWLKKVEDWNPNNMREQYLRRAVYVNSYHDAVAKGLTGKEAATVAEFTSQNATTNFSRAFAWGNNLVASVPFLGAAINGQASFWRLFELDPVGISSRLINGIIMPMISLVTQSLQSVQDREVYKTIPEYEKENAIVFVVDGAKMSIPVPQELSSFIAPFRHMVEKASDANDNTWMELTTNDILGVSPIDLKGLVNLDRNKLLGDPTIMDRLSDESAALISQLSPVFVKTIYMAYTGIDPYTGAPIDASRVYQDENGVSQIIDSKGNAALSWLSERFKDLGIDVSASTMHALFKSFFGNATTDAFDILSTLFGGEGSIGQRMEEAAGITLGRIGSPISPSSSNDPGRLQFTAAVKELEKQRDSIINSKKFQGITDSLRNLDSSDPNYETKQTNLLKERREMIQDFQQSVFNMVEQYQAEFGKTYDRKMFASTINLLTFYKDYSDNLMINEQNTNKQMYYNARNNALRTMNEYGFSSPNDLSIFGYIRTDEYGNAQAKATSPVAIMTLGSDVWGQSDRNIANIEAALEKAQLTRKEMFGDEYKKAKAAGKAAYKKYKSEWNKKVVKEIAPYVESIGVDAVIDDFTTRDMLDNIIFVDNPFKAKDLLKKVFGKESE